MVECRPGTCPGRRSRSQGGAGAAAAYVVDGGVATVISDLISFLCLRQVRGAQPTKRVFHGPETTVVAARLFGSLSGFADVPDPCFWRVVEYAWLGDWRHP